MQNNEADKQDASKEQKGEDNLIKNVVEKKVFNLSQLLGLFSAAFVFLVGPIITAVYVHTSLSNKVDYINNEMTKINTNIQNLNTTFDSKLKAQEDKLEQLNTDFRIHQQHLSK